MLNIAALVKLSFLCILLYALVLTLLWRKQEELIFLPKAINASQEIPKSLRARDVSERFIEVDRANLSVLELRLPKPSGVVFFLHGNAGNNHTWAGDLDLYRELNFDFVMLDYRSYGKSQGAIESQAQLHADVAAVWADVAPRYKDKRIVFMGRSLGSGFATHLAANLPESQQPHVLILVSAYSSMVAMVNHLYPWVPSVLLRYPLRTDEAIKGFRGSLLLVHGEKDDLIPAKHSEALKSIVPGALLEIIPGAGHGNLERFPRYLELVGAKISG